MFCSQKKPPRRTAANQRQAPELLFDFRRLGRVHRGLVPLRALHEICQLAGCIKALLGHIDLMPVLGVRRGLMVLNVSPCEFMIARLDRSQFLHVPSRNPLFHQGGLGLGPIGFGSSFPGFGFGLVRIGLLLGHLQRDFLLLDLLLFGLGLHLLLLLRCRRRGRFA
jgi:hypothetical protein